MLLAESGAQRLFGDGEADRIRDPLAKRAGGGLDPAGMAVFRVAGGLGAPLAEVPDLVDRHVGIAGQVQQCIEQHRAVACRQDEAVAVGPVGIGGIELQVFLEQHRRHVGHAHRHAGVARVRGLDRIHRQHADGAGLHPMIGVRLTQGRDIQLQAPPLVVFAVFGGLQRLIAGWDERSSARGAAGGRLRGAFGFVFGLRWERRGARPIRRAPGGAVLRKTGTGGPGR